VGYEFEHEVKMDIETRVTRGVKAVLEEVLEGSLRDRERPLFDIRKRPAWRLFSG
jgi:hypothetical protein